MNKLAIFGLALVALSGCAKRPDAIVPVDIPMAAFSGMSCPALARELVAEQEKLAALSKTQNKAATGDAIGVFLVIVPVGSLVGGDKEGEISVSKGKVLAIENSIRQRSC